MVGHDDTRLLLLQVVSAAQRPPQPDQPGDVLADRRGQDQVEDVEGPQREDRYEHDGHAGHEAHVQRVLEVVAERLAEEEEGGREAGPGQEHAHVELVRHGQLHGGGGRRRGGFRQAVARGEPQRGVQPRRRPRRGPRRLPRRRRRRLPG